MRTAERAESLRLPANSVKAPSAWTSLDCSVNALQWSGEEGTVVPSTTFWRHRPSRGVPSAGDGGTRSADRGTT